MVFHSGQIGTGFAPGPDAFSRATAQRAGVVGLTR